jgi:hypothetical protein
MRIFRLTPAIAAMSALLALAPASGQTPRLTVGGQWSAPPHSGMHGGFHHGFRASGFLIIPETEVVHDVVVVHDQPIEPPAPPPPPLPPKEPWVFGRTYASLPGGCMKLVERGAAYFLCSGEWYRQVGSRQYKAVAGPL